MSSLRLAVSHNFLYKKLDEFGHDHLEHSFDSMKKKGKALCPAADTCPLNSNGRKLIIGNFNYMSQPHKMTDDRQNKVVNWVGLMITKNRISGAYLDSTKPLLEKLLELENGLCLPNNIEHYIALCGRIAVKYIKCLQNFDDCTSKHIKHQYSSLTCQQTKTVRN